MFALVARPGWPRFSPRAVFRQTAGVSIVGCPVMRGWVARTTVVLSFGMVDLTYDLNALPSLVIRSLYPK